ncbi:MAG: response regulator [Myxococcales bacterium]|nr:response regulator [Myxococcales bacterium]
MHEGEAKTSDSHRVLADDQFVRRLWNSLFTLVGVLEPDGTLLDANDAALRVANLEISDVRGKKFWDCYWWSYSPKVANNLQEVCTRAARGETVRSEAIVRIRDDARMMVDFQITPALDDGGNVEYLIASGVDITSSRSAEEALRVSEERESLLVRLLKHQRETEDPEAMMLEAAATVGRQLRANRVGFFEMDGDDTLDFGPCWTDGVLEPLTGAFPAQGIGSRYLDEVRAGRTIGISDVEVSSLTQDSNFSEINSRSIIGAPIIRFQRWAAGFYVNHASVREWTADDISLVRAVADQTWDAVERARAIRALRENEQRLLIATEAAGLGIFDQDVPHNLIRWDEHVRGFWGVGADETITYETFSAGLHPDDREATERAIERAFDPAGDGRYEAEYRVVHRKTGASRWLSALGHVQFEAGRPQRLIGAVQDITAKKRAEEVLREEQRRKDLFLATMGHELRNPLAAIDLELRLTEENIQAFAKLPAKLVPHVNQLKELVNDLLEVTRFARGKLKLRKGTADLMALVRSAARTVQADVDENNQRLTIEGPVTLSVEADAVRVEQIVWNLLSNASKYTPRGGRIEAQLAREGDQAILRVRDTGQGLVEDQLSTIFEPFIQNDPPSGGLGIGLALARSLAELHGGSVSAESPGAGQGATFTVRLPIGDPKRAEEPPTPPATDLSPNLRVLIVDDVADAADALALLIGKKGPQTRCVYTGEAAVEALDEFRPHVALIDLGLPDITGFEVAEEIRSRPGGEDTLLLAITGFGDAENGARALEAGFDRRVVKPVDPEMICDLIRKLGPDA